MNDKDNSEVEEIKKENIETEEKKAEPKILNKMEKVGKEIGEWAICLFVAFLIAVSIKYYIGTFTTVKQLSMDPTLKQNDRLWLNRTTRTFNKEYKVGDIATFEAPELDTVIRVNNTYPEAIFDERKSFSEKFTKDFLEIGKTSYIKRIIAKEGDRVQIEDGRVFVNGEELEEKYLPEGTVTSSTNLTDFIVPENTFFLMGDNRKNSTDSRAFGCIPIEKMEGRVVVRILPINKMGSIPNTYEK